MEERTIISIAEFRRLSGLSLAVVTDEQALEIIGRLDTMAQIYIKQTAIEPKEKRDAKEQGFGGNEAKT